MRARVRNQPLVLTVAELVSQVAVFSNPYIVRHDNACSAD
jgi:hypothetical protein